MQIRRFNLPSIMPAFKDVLGRLGYNKKRTELSDIAFTAVENCLEYSLNFIHPLGNTVEDEITEKSSSVVKISCGIEFRSEKLSKILINSKKLTLMACTIGNQLKNEIERLEKDGDITRAVILDAIASEAAEAFANYITGVLEREKIMLGLRPTMRFSPGYGDLKTDVHLKMLPVLESESIGISFNKENFILYPEKSITALTGWEK